MIDIKTIKNNWKFQVYRVSSKTTPYVYIGVVTSFAKSYISRFIEHMTDNGSTSFRYVLGNNFDPEDFYVDLIDCCDTKNECLKLEAQYIRECNPFHSLNMINQRNTSMYIKIIEFYERYVLLDGYCSRLHMYIHRELESPLGDYIFKNVYKGTNDNGRLNRFFSGKSAFRQTEAWRIAKKIRSERRARKDHTDREVAAYARRKDETRDDWQSLTKEQAEKKSRGLRMMNNPAVCPNCKKLSR